MRPVRGPARTGDRDRTVAALDGRLAQAPDDEFARATISLEGWAAVDLASTLRANRSRDAAAGRATEGPHRQDLAVTHRAKQMPAAQSSTGEQKALLLGLVLAHADLVAERRGAPAILLLDEVLSGLTPTEAQEATGIVRSINDRGITIVMVEHVMEVVMSLCRRLVVLDFGEKIFEGTPDAAVKDTAVLEAYLGSTDA